MSCATSSPLPQRAAAELLLRRRRRRHELSSFRNYLEAVSPEMDWTPPHLVASQRVADEITTGPGLNVIELMPPRHGKSQQGTVRYPAYRIEKDPTLPVIIAAYNQTLAEKFSRQTRKIVRRRGITLNPERNTAADWETEQGGGVRAVGQGGGVTGQGGGLVVVDDPIKNRIEAESPVYRDRTWDWFTDDIWTRREPGASVVIRVTPWHHDDLVGRILRDPEIGPLFRVIRFPAYLEEGETDTLGRKPYEALWPARYPIEALLQIKGVLGEYGFSALYQCRPTPRSGNMFPRDKVEIVPSAPANARRARAWDKAGTKDGGKRTAGVRMALHEGLVYVEDVVAGQWAAAERERVIKQTTAADGHGISVEIEQEPGSGGKESAEATIKMLQGYSVHARPATGDKATRADPFAAQWQGGNVRLVAGDWNRAYLDEMEMSPEGKFSDRMDASAMAYNALTQHIGQVGMIRMGYF